MGTLRQDLRFALRMLVRERSFSLIAVLVLTLGIGGNSAIFSLVNALLFRPLALAQPERLVGTYSKSLATADTYRAFSYPNYADLRDRNGVFSGLAAHNLAMVGLSEGDSTRRAFADIVSADYFSTLGVEPFRGRTFLPAEERPGSSIPVAIVSHALWKRTGADSALVGKQIRVNARSFTVVGIAPPGFSGTTAMFSPEIWLPLGMYESVINDFQGERRPLADRDNHCLILIGRLAPGVTPARAGSELAVLATQLREAFPKENAEQTVTVAPLSRVSISTAPVDDRALSTVAVLLTAMAGVVLLIACLNLANMLLARGTARRKEFAIRLAIGGGRGTLVRQLLVEGLLLSVVGGIAGSLLAYAGNRLLLASLTRMLPIPILFPLAPDLRAIAALAGFCLLATLLFGLGPALQMVKPGVVEGLKESAGQDRATGRLRGLLAPRNLLVVAQLVLSTVLLAAAGLFVRGALAAGNPDLGYRVEHVLLAELDPSLAGSPESDARALFRRVEERAATLPGVRSVSFAATVPFGMVSLGDKVAPAGALPRAAGDAEAEARTRGAGLNIVGADYFATLEMPLLRGRAFTRGEEESAGAPPVAIVDRALAERLFPGEDALGRRIELARRAGVEYEIVGIAPEVRAHLFESPGGGVVYLPLGRDFQSNLHLLLRTSDLDAGRQESLAQQLRREIRGVDERLPILGLKSLRDQLDGSVELWMLRTGGRLFAIFGTLALFLAAVGAYGVRAYAVGQRTREIGVRMALGASPRHALRMVLKEGLGLAAVGLGLGLVAALGVGRLLSGFLYQVSAADPVVFSVAPLFLAGAITLACWFPARRAARVDPMVALRDQ